jgi:uncharacterized membrane protein
MVDERPRRSPGHFASGPGDADPPEGSTSRIEAFSDAVIAVAATILVLEIAHPPDGVDVWTALSQQLPSLLAYVISFLTILIFWVNHHETWRMIRDTDRGIQFLNGLLLLAISFISYSTAAVGQAFESGADASSAAVLYSSVLGFGALCFTGIWVYLAGHRRLLRGGDSRALARSAVIRSLAGPVLYAIAALVALLSPAASLIIDAAVALFFALVPSRVFARLFSS